MELPTDAFVETATRELTLKGLTSASSLELPVALVLAALWLAGGALTSVYVEWLFTYAKGATR
jgi:hypothetical protein